MYTILLSEWQARDSDLMDEAVATSSCSTSCRRAVESSLDTGARELVTAVDHGSLWHAIYLVQRCAIGGDRLSTCRVAIEYLHVAHNDKEEKMDECYVVWKVCFVWGML